MSQSSASGNYRGWYEQGGRKEHMTLSLAIDQGRIHGSGHDVVGPFSIDGTVVDNATQFTKAYPTHPVSYSGTINGKVISGSWRITAERSGFVDAGAFRIWRDGMAGCGHEQESAEEERTVFLPRKASLGAD